MGPQAFLRTVPPYQLRGTAHVFQPNSLCSCVSVCLSVCASVCQHVLIYMYIITYIYAYTSKNPTRKKGPVYLQKRPMCL